MKNKAGSIVGIGVGVAIGIFIFSASIAFLSAWLLVIFPFFIVVLLICAFVGGRIGYKNEKKPPMWLPYAVILIGWPAAFYLPFVVQQERMEIFSRSLPDYPGAELVEKELRTANTDSMIGYSKKYRTHDTAEQVLRFYKNALTKIGCVSSVEEDDDDYRCRRGGDSFQVSVNATYFDVPVDSHGGKSYGPDDVDPSTREIVIYADKR